VSAKAWKFKLALSGVVKKTGGCFGNQVKRNWKSSSTFEMAYNLKVIYKSFCGIADG